MMHLLKSATIVITLFVIVPFSNLYAQTKDAIDNNNPLTTSNTVQIVEEAASDNATTFDDDSTELPTTQKQALPSLPFATIEGLNKITAKATPISTKVDTLVNFGNLEANIHYCWQSPPEEEPENKALISIFEQVPGEDRKRIFHGWMFASTPGISALEHPIYDITLLSCDKANPAHNDEVTTN